MSYARLIDVWPDFQNSNKFKKYKNTLPENIVSELVETSDSRGGNKYVKNMRKEAKKAIEPVMYERSREYPLDYEKERKKVPIEKFSNVMYGKYYSECSTILKHLSVCAKCRDYIQKKFVPKEQPKEEDEEVSDEYLDLAIYIVTGIFVLFLLDILIKFGRKR